MTRKNTDKHQQLLALMKSVNTDKPKPNDLAAFRQLLKEKPDALDYMGDLTKEAQRALAKTFKGSELMSARVERDIERTVQELGYAQSSPLEKMLIDLVALNKAWLFILEWLVALAIRRPNQSASSALYLERRLNMVQARHLRALESLARVRRLLRPTANVQVNIADQQLNVVQAPSRTTRQRKTVATAEAGAAARRAARR